jgi:hypothetical protein
MALFDPSSIIIYITLSIIFVIFIIFDVFKRGEKYSLLAYIMALPLINYIWFKITEGGISAYSAYQSFGVLGVYLILVLLWIVVMLRDTYNVIKKKKEIDDVLLFLLVALLVQFILSAILPSVNLIPDMQNGCSGYLTFFYLPELYTITGALNPVIDPRIVLAFQISITVLVILICIPLLNDIRGEEANFLTIIVITAIFIIPFWIISYIWAPPMTAVLTFLFSVIFFVALLLVTKSGRKT